MRRLPKISVLELQTLGSCSHFATKSSAGDISAGCWRTQKFPARQILTKKNNLPQREEPAPGWEIKGARYDITKGRVSQTLKSGESEKKEKKKKVKGGPLESLLTGRDTDHG